jgi:hypothetical protein
MNDPKLEVRILGRASVQGFHMSLLNRAMAYNAVRVLDTQGQLSCPTQITADGKKVDVQVSWEDDNHVMVAVPRHEEPNSPLNRRYI